MNRNVESHFSKLPNADIQRSIFDRSHSLKTSFNAGELVPICVDEVLPGDSIQMTTSKVVRLQTMLTPIMDNIYLDVYWFFVPARLTWTHWKEFMGENTESAWIPQTEYTIPTIGAPPTYTPSEGDPVIGFKSGTIADYMGLPVGISWNKTDALAPIALPFRAYALICNEFFRDENLTDPLVIDIGDSNIDGANGIPGTSYDYEKAYIQRGGPCFKVAKYHDYFTSALPSPQKGPAVSVSPFTDGPLPVITNNVVLPTDLRSDNALRWYKATGDHSNYLANVNGATLGFGPSSSFTKGFLNDEVNEGSNTLLAPLNLWADTSGRFQSISVNDLRLAFQLQKFYERNARSGSRYIEVIKAHFGVTSPDARLQRPEYLGGNRVPLNIHEVTNNAQSENDFLGDLGAKSATSDVHFDFQKSFTEHGYILGVACVRYDHSYPQGFNKMWMRHNQLDFYDPLFANLGEMPIWDAEIYANSTSIGNKNVFGYQEAWAEYRYSNNRCTGEMRPGISNSLASWNLSDYYETKPTLSDGWIREDKTNIDRTLAVTSENANQIFADFYFNSIWTRPMPMYSIPGLIDHH